MSDPTDTHDEAAEQPAAETPSPEQSPTMRLVPALADTTPAPLTAEQIAAGEQAAREAFGGAPALLEQPPAPSVVVITAGVDQISPRPEPTEPACDDSPDCRCPACVGAQIATHGHALASPR